LDVGLDKISMGGVHQASLSVRTNLKQQSGSIKEHISISTHNEEDDPNGNE
jgi:hypothetical protein